MDICRRGKVNQYKMRKDRLHQIATGLLLQIGLLELEIPDKKANDNILSQEKYSIDINGDVYMCRVREVVKLLENYNSCTDISELKVPIEVKYGQLQCGKPYWKLESLKELSLKKKFHYFNISHSGEYVAVIICDEEVGLDIQEKRKIKYPGGYREFSRMEAYVKCTGEGYAKGFNKYNEVNGHVADVLFYRVNVLQDYVIWLCNFKKERGNHEEKNNVN